ncbi:histidine kinase [Streptomyces sp. SID13726]|uniref:sensor histidine kinase n=1 Tax=Streptomyces sp. SID13726 TaxID=2706058 RepID=UPI0013B8FD14|nr:histidine kinase [Streptomyces sp. SID13726]NEA98893.1 histidine kinase [Streptomyces sp. SID13726]
MRPGFDLGKVGVRPLPDQDIPTYWLTRAIAFVPLAYIASQLLLDLVSGRTARPGSGSALLALFALVALVFTAQSVIMRTGTRYRGRGRTLAVLGAQAVLTYLPLLWFGHAWNRMTGPLAASVLLVNMRGVWLLWTLVVAGSLGVAWTEGSLALAVSCAVNTVLTGWMIWGFSRLSSLVAEVHAEREELARVAVTRERLRFSRDLHDLLGGSLSTIILKGEVARRLVPAEECRARQEITAILAASRQVLADLRVLARGYRCPLSFEAEQELVRSALAMADVEVTMVTTGQDGLDPALDAVLAVVLREGTTNVIRHSEARTLDVTFTASDDCVRLVMVNDGVDPDTAGHPGGQGLANLAARLAELDGRVESGATGDGRFRLVAEIPLRPTHA